MNQLLSMHKKLEFPEGLVRELTLKYFHGRDGHGMEFFLKQPMEEVFYNGQQSLSND